MVLSGPHPIISCNYHGRLLEAFYMGEGEGGSCTNSGMRNNLGKGKYKLVDAGYIWGIWDLRLYMLTYFGSNLLSFMTTFYFAVCGAALQHSDRIPLHYCTAHQLPSASAETKFYTSSCSFGLKFTVSMQHWEQKLSNYQITWLSLFRFGSYYTIEISKWKLKLHHR